MMKASRKDIKYRPQVDDAVTHRTANSKANITIMFGRACWRTVLTENDSISTSKIVETTSDVESRTWKSRGFDGGCCSSTSTRPSPIQPQTLPMSRLTNITKNQPPTSSRNIVMARHVSVTANQAFSYNCSTSMGRSGPYRSFCNASIIVETARRATLVKICTISVENLQQSGVSPSSRHYSVLGRRKPSRS